MLMGGQYVIEGGGLLVADTSGKSMFNPAGSLRAGIIEWVNIEAGFSRGMNLGFKGRILGETGPIAPSLAIGARNIISNREAGLFHTGDSSTDSTIASEFYIACAKSIDPIKMRLHVGIQTLPKTKSDVFDPFFGIEQYFGNGLYGTLEVFKRKEKFHPSLFVSWRFWGRHAEFSFGAVGINRLFFEDNKFKFSLGSKGPDEFVKPGLWFGLRYIGLLGSGSGKKGAFMTIEDRVGQHEKSIEELRLQVDSLRKNLAESQKKMTQMKTSLSKLNDSLDSDKTRFKPVLLEKIIDLKNLYAEEPFEPERAKRLIREIAALGEDALPALREIMNDKRIDRNVRVLCITLLGEIGNSGASDVLLDILNQTQDPQIKIEILIALGKMKETRAEYVMEQLANDPVDEVAFTAQEVLQKLAKETGIKVSPDFKRRRVELPDSAVVKEKKIRTLQQNDTSAAKPQKPEKRKPQTVTPDTLKAPTAGQLPADSSRAAKPATGGGQAKDTIKVKPQSGAIGDLWESPAPVDSAGAVDKKVSPQGDQNAPSSASKDSASLKKEPVKPRAAPDKKTVPKKPAKKAQAPKKTTSPDDQNW